MSKTNASIMLMYVIGGIKCCRTSAQLKPTYRIAVATYVHAQSVCTFMLNISLGAIAID